MTDLPLPPSADPPPDRDGEGGDESMPRAPRGGSSGDGRGEAAGDDASRRPTGADDAAGGAARKPRKRRRSKRGAKPKSAAGTPRAEDGAPSGETRRGTRRRSRGAARRGPAAAPAARAPLELPDAPRDDLDANARPKPKRATPKVTLGGAVLIGGGAGKRKKAARPRKPEPVAGPKEGTIFRGLTLNPFQQQALVPLQEGRSVLLAAPTGAGKTLVAEMAIEMSLTAGKRAIYTAPIKALSNQKFRDFKAIDVERVGIMTGDVTIRPHAPLLIMTTEIFRNTIFENPAGLDDVHTVVFDEVHYMDDPERGTVWEESIIFAPPHVRFVCLSATVSNLGQLGDWISAARGEDVEVIRHTDRPVPLDHYAFFPSSGLRKLERPVRFPKTHVEAMRKRGGGGRGRPQQRKDPNEIIDVLQRQEALPVLFFCFSRKECEQRAREVARHHALLSLDHQKRIVELFESTCEAFEITPSSGLEELHGLITRGIAFHHAGMLPLHKELVERLFTSALLQALFCTETFSLGINMPARTVVFSSLRKFDGTGFSSLKVREYQQMAGRAGRQGIDDKGLVVSIIDDHRILPAEVDHLIGNDVEPVVSRFNLSYSTLINLHRTLGDRLYEAWERSFNNYQWSRMSAKKRERNEQRQRDAIDRRLRLLGDLGYITPEGVTEKGRIAATINGYELQVVELLDSGLLDWLDEIQAAIVFSAISFEERKTDLFRRLPNSVMGHHRRDVEELVDGLIRRERELGIPPTVKPPNFKVGVVVHDWCQGKSFDEMREDTTAPFGDMVRSMRLTVQLLRQLQSALPKTRPLVKVLDRARQLLNRDEVDAARQLSLG
ncbi:MAG: DEAD/DEAH box helicase [Planctomycetes bacterium]|nr:DEAD/DEAH box helicase [Planctomycetota bacterium]